MKNLAVEFDGTPCAVKAACTVWSGGKSGDYIKGLPIAIRREVAGHETVDGGRRRTKNLYGVFKRTVPAGQVRQ